MPTYEENMAEFPIYTRKVTTARAMRWTGENLETLFKFVPMNKLRFKNNRIYIKTANGKVKLCVGDYIVSNNSNDFYPLRPEVFEEHYCELL